MKNIAVIIRSTPLNNVKSLEAIRSGLGLTFYDDKVIIIFLDDGVWSATELNPEAIKPDVILTKDARHLKGNIETFMAMNGRLIVDKESAEARGIKKFIKEAEIMTREEIFKIITECDVVIPFA
ncbi:MAG: DsrE family protein [Euryarchaeota archaeon]|nr:DsrE family protein [Euryarchaeota archaeon]